MQPHPQTYIYNLAMAADRLAQHNGPEWASFCQALGQHAEAAMMKVLTADPGSVLNVQGRAAALNDLCNTLFHAKAVAADALRLMTPPSSPPKPAP